jgi:malonate-semialdehyde dehydrogenase (acetylating) / methylmalonate-semialdehyde dehydrogenase
MLRQLSNSTPRTALSSKRFLATASIALSTVAQTHASSLSNWPGTSFSGGQIKNYIGGSFVESKANKWIDVHDPSTQSVLSRVPETTENEFEDAVGAAKEAFETWRRTSVLTRQRFVME